MKLYIGQNPTSIYNGHVKAIGRNHGSLNDYADDAECSEIVIDELLSLDEIDGAVKKLGHGGILKVCGLDTYEASYAYLMGSLDAQTFTENIRRSQNHYTLLDVANRLLGNGLQLLCKKYVDGYHYWVEGKRP